MLLYLYYLDNSHTFVTKKKIMRLSELKTGESAVILKVLGHGGFRRRIIEMGFIRGKNIEVVLNAPLRDPIQYKIMGYDISLRRSEAEMVKVITKEEAEILMTKEQSEYGSENLNIESIISHHSKKINIALVGNPNSGKTSLFNTLSGSREHVGNYSGVTVDAKRGYLSYKGYQLEITDLPGTYALSAYSPEELYVRNHLAKETPDVIVNIVAASNLERNLYLTTELIDTNPRMVVALNMYDELEASGAKLNYEHLGAMMGVPMIPTIAKGKKGINELLDTIISVYENENKRVRHIHINQGIVVEESIKRLSHELKLAHGELPKYFPPRYFAIKLLENDKDIEKALSHAPQYAGWIELRNREVKRIREALEEDVETALANHKYGFIAGALKETYIPGDDNQRSVTTVIDTIVTDKLWGFPIFFFLMWLMFYSTFQLGAYPQSWIGSLVGWLSSIAESSLAEGKLKELIIDGVIGGVGGVIIFLPNIIILYLFISFFENSGYLARASFIMDKVMHRIGLHGKSFIPLIMGFGCNVPAIMATRTIESFSSRLITIMIVPFMSCSARLPIYVLFAGTFFPEHGGTILFLMYVVGIFVAITTARLMRRFMFKSDETPFIMELPPYRLPTLKTTLIHMWDKCAIYLKKMGGMILVASIAIWFLSNYPTSPSDMEGEPIKYENSYLGIVGKACEPIFSPLGFNWKANVAILTSIAAKEVVVSTLGVLYSEEGEGGTTIDDKTLSSRLLASNDFTTASAFSFLIFVLIFFPCIATIIGIAAEAGWKWAAASVIYNTTLAWLLAYITYNIINWIF